MGILFISLGAAISLCSGTDSATTCTSGNYTTYCTGGKIQPPKPLNNSSHFFPEMWDEVATFLELVIFLTIFWLPSSGMCCFHRGLGNKQGLQYSLWYFKRKVCFAFWESETETWKSVCCTSLSFTNSWQLYTAQKEELLLLSYSTGQHWTLLRAFLMLL